MMTDELLPEHKTEKTDFEYLCTDFVEAVRTCLKTGGYSKVENNTEEGGFFLIGYRKKLYQVESDFQVGIPEERWDAIGCGKYYALGSMNTGRYITDPENRIKEALKVAAHYSAGVRGPFKIRSI